MRVKEQAAFDRRSPEEKSSPVTKWVFTAFSTLWMRVAEAIQAINGNLTFGTGLYPDNLAGRWVDYTSNAIANTEDAVVHNLAVIPVGFLVMIPPLTGTINKGTTPWTTTTIYIKCSAASQTARLFILPPPRS